jgi:cyclohexanecarboxylate-CoA ligase
MTELAETYRAKDYWTDRLLIDFFEDAVRRCPDKIAVTDDRHGGQTYSELAVTVRRLAAALQAQGVGSGDNFIVALPNWRHVSAFVLALGYIGAVGVHMPVTGRQHEFAAVFRISKAKGVIVPGEFRGHDYMAMIGGMADKPALRVAVGGEPGTPGWTTFDELLIGAAAQGPNLDDRPTPSDVTTVLFTSGSSGEPKGVMHSSNTIGAQNVTVAPIFGLGPDDVIFMGAPLGYSAGLAHGVRQAINLGATLVLQESWDGDRALETMARHKATFTMTTPALLRDLLFSERLAALADELTSLRLIFCGGTYVPSELLRQAREILPATHTTVIWGMAEGTGAACRPGTPESRVLTTDGEPFLGTELRILRPNGDDAPAGEEGELVMRGPQLFLGYLNAPDDLNEESFLPGGWFRTGDVARIGEDGFIKITGRSKELIIRGGENISPAEIEERLLCDPRIRQLAVVDMPDERLGERVCACVVSADGSADLTLADLADIARRQGLAKHKWPERLELMEALPLTAAGKIRRPALREYLRRRARGDSP